MTHRHRLLRIGACVALLSGTACSGVRTGRPAASAQAAPSPAALDSTLLRRPRTDVCVAHPHAFTLLAAHCGFVGGTTRGALVARYAGFDDWERPLSSLFPDTSDRPMPFRIDGPDHRAVMLYVRGDSVGPILFDGYPAMSRFATPRAPLVMVTTYGVARDTTHFRATLDSIETGIRAAGGILVGCRREPLRSPIPNRSVLATWRVGDDYVSLFAGLDTLETPDTLTARWSIERTRTLKDRPLGVEPGCTMPATSDIRVFAEEAARGYATPYRAARRFRALVGSCEVTRLSGILNHPRCDGVPSIQEYFEREREAEERRRTPTPIP